MNRENWGIKRVCLSCGARFYDLNKSPIVCPTCGTVIDPDYLAKRKSRTMQDKSDDIVGDIDVVVDDDVLIDEDSASDLDDTDDSTELDNEKN
jgi:uncharacterized protein (TIGR02300 family)